MKNINNLTINEFNRYKLLVEDNDQFGILELFEIKNPEELSVEKYTKTLNNIMSQTFEIKKVNTVYKLNGKRYKVELNLTKINAGQFIDLQNYMMDFNLHQVLSVFLIPQEKTLFGWKTKKYNDGYDIFDVQNDILNCMTIGDGNSIAGFFLNSSEILLKTMNNSLMKKKAKMLLKKK